jgi:hypothetical protein
MTDTADNRNKVKKPHASFEEPHDVVIDPALSTGQKRKALEALEQDARQLSLAASEGMTGGEYTGLRDVLDAKDTLALAPVDQAYAVVLKDLKSRLKGNAAGEARIALERALVAIEALQRRSTPEDGSVAERAEEAKLAKLDP